MTDSVPAYKREGIIAETQQHVIFNRLGYPYQECNNEISSHTDAAVGRREDIARRKNCRHQQSTGEDCHTRHSTRHTSYRSAGLATTASGGMAVHLLSSSRSIFTLRESLYYFRCVVEIVPHSTYHNHSPRNITDAAVVVYLRER